MGNADSGTKPQPQPIRDAATLVLYRRRGDRLEVLMGERHGASAFMPNRYVFPGGRLDLSDYRIRPAAPLNAVSAARLGRTKGTGPRKALALALAAIRETWEESGLRLAAPERQAGTPPPGWAGFCEDGLAPDASALLYCDATDALSERGLPRKSPDIAGSDRKIGRNSPLRVLAA